MSLEVLKKFTLLYIEDEPFIRENAVEYLTRYCKKVYEAKDGLEGWEQYLAHSPDLIISDIKMPRLNGLDLASRIRQKDKTTPIILATAHTETEYLLQAVELQLIKYIVKPITADKLQEALDLACEALESDHSSSCITLDEKISYDTLNQILIKNNQSIKLTYNELLFFDFLVKNRQ